MIKQRKDVTWNDGKLMYSLWNLDKVIKVIVKRNRSTRIFAFIVLDSLLCNCLPNYFQFNASFPYLLFFFTIFKKFNTDLEMLSLRSRQGEEESIFFSNRQRFSAINKIFRRYWQILDAIETKLSHGSCQYWNILKMYFFRKVFCSL